MERELLYVALGDSTGTGAGAQSGGGYPERLVRLLPARLRLSNLCRSGATSADVLSDQLPLALRSRPRLISLGIGINDLGLQLPDESFALNLEEIAIGLSPAVARLVPRLLYEKRIEMFNEHVTATAARHDLTLIDLYALSREIVPGRPELFSPDGYHPSALGYDEWARRMAPAVEQLLGVGVAATG
ncbi:MAG: SGNH/GDSL hydrolase family protein [Deltaproteobacteria bacterium]|nr:MAG: SGNH/GDSL hydrolase family protein [Deltaproteobacteria bacterium]